MIEENRMINDVSYTVHITELRMPDSDLAGYCYPINNTKTYRYNQ